MNRKLCCALLDRSAKAFDRIRDRAIARGQDPDAAVRARLRHHGFCTRPALPGSDRCQWHGGHSTGPTTEGGMARTVAAMVEGRTRWLAELKARGEPLTMGRKKGGKNRTPEERDEVRRTATGKRAGRQVTYESRAIRRARKQARRQERVELANHRARQKYNLRWGAEPDRWLVAAELRQMAQERWEAAKTNAAEARKQRDSAREEAQRFPSPKSARKLPPVPRGHGKPAWQAHPSHSAQARELEKLERTFLEQLNVPSHRTPLDPAELEAAYQRIVAHEAMIATPGRERRLERLRFEIEAWRSRVAVEATAKRAAAAIAEHAAAQAAVAGPARKELVEASPPAPRQPPPGDSHPSLPPAENIDRLRLEIDRRRQYLSQFGTLPESMARRLDDELRRAQLGRNDHDALTGQLAVLDRWIASGERAVAMTKAIVAGRDKSWDERSMSPRPPEKRLTIK